VNTQDSIAANIAEWTETNAQHTDANAQRAWDHEGILWGVFAVPEEQVGALPDVNGLDVVELGCGTAYFGSWLARRGARVTGVDPTPAQLATARRMMTQKELEFPLVEAPGEDVPLPDASFDLAVSEYGASLWADPYKWIPEAARLLRPDGELVFLRNSTLSMLCTPDTGTVQESLQRPQLGLNRMDWADTHETEFQPAHGDLIRLLRKSGFEILDMVEFFASADSKNHPFYGEYMTVEWAQKWPSEEMWRARKR
jgi:ubiquinone/menaquinone biosynthesis C-methylase UbiE